VRDRRNDQRRRGARAGTLAGSVGSRLWTSFADRPVDSFAILGAVAASLVIVVNAMFLQSGSRPAPFVANPTLPKTDTVDVAPKPVPRIVDLNTHAAPQRPVQAAPVPVPTPSPRRNDPIADLITPSPRIMAVQRALSNYGYGQLQPSGLLDDATSHAIEKFERDRKMPVTGRMSDRLVNELTVVTGHSLE
jgi:hypothetical protein